ncbi:MAG: hypothetical protein E3J89_05025 [Candidatus Aminicenantes bacterium]|nr:MAG: hypothetical protein E3J89_05025 [Candidatus Aminicenantes bacterium]
MKMEPIYDQNGRTVGWLKEDVVYYIDGSPCTFIRNGNIFNYEGDYLGRLNRGFFRDKDGNAVAFMRGATGGPIPPISEVSPVPPIPAIPTIPPIPAVPPVPPIPSLNWSNISWEEFLKGGF